MNLEVFPSFLKDQLSAGNSCLKYNQVSPELMTKIAYNHRGVFRFNIIIDDLFISLLSDLGGIDFSIMKDTDNKPSIFIPQFQFSNSRSFLTNSLRVNNTNYYNGREKITLKNEGYK